MPKYLIAICLVIGIIDAFRKMSASKQVPVDSQPEYSGLLDFLLNTNK